MPEVFDTLDDLVRAGKIRFYGVSVERVEEALKAIEYPALQSIQIIFNAFRQRPAELLFAEAKRRQVGIIVRLPLVLGHAHRQDDASHQVRGGRPPPVQPRRGRVRQGRNVLRRRLRDRARSRRGALAVWCPPARRWPSGRCVGSSCTMR